MALPAALPRFLRLASLGVKARAARVLRGIPNPGDGEQGQTELKHRISVPAPEVDKATRHRWAQGARDLDRQVTSYDVVPQSENKERVRA